MTKPLTIQDIQNSPLNREKETVDVKLLRGKNGKIVSQARVDYDKDGVDITDYYIISHYDLLALCAGRGDFNTTEIQIRVLKHPIVTRWQKRQRLHATARKIADGIARRVSGLVDGLKKMSEEK